MGALNIYSAETHAFGDEEISLLEELAREISFGIQSLREREKRRQGEQRHLLWTKILEILNRPNASPDDIEEIMQLIKKHTHIGAIAIRLAEGEDFPLKYSSGFPDNFMAREKYLCEWDREGNCLRDEREQPVLACMCGAVIQKRTDPQQHFFTLGGSFLTNNASKLLSSAGITARLILPRGYCPAAGYESMAIIPLRSGDETIGLLMLSDPRPDLFSTEEVQFLEQIGSAVGVAGQRQRRKKQLRAANKALISENSERIEAEKAHRQSEDRLQKIVSSLPVILWSIDLDGTFTFSEGKGLKDLGLEPHEVVGQSVFETYASTPDICRLARRALTGEKFSSRTRISERTYESFCSPRYDDRKKLIGTICVLADMTAQEQMRDEIERTRRLASLGELSAGIAHEINNPNALILLNSKQLQKIYAETSPILTEYAARHSDFRLCGIPYREVAEQLPEMISGLLDASRRIKRIVGDLKDFSYLREGDLEGVTDLNLEAQSAIRFSEKTLHEATHNFSANFSETPLLVQGNSPRIEQIIINLVQNACQALENGSQEICLTVREEGANAILEILDQGRGIPMEILPRVKEPFFTTKRSSGGTGLGLSVSSSIAEEFGGRLEFSSQPGFETIARLSLPLKIKEITDA